MSDKRGKVLLEQADQHFGVLRLAHFEAQGLDRRGVHRWVVAGRLTRLHRGVYAYGHSALTPEGRWLAATWAAGEAAVLSHLSAGAYHRMLDDDPQSDTDVSTTARADPRPGVAVHRVRHLDRVDVHRAYPIVVTTIPRTIVDLADVLDWTAFRAAVDNLPKLRLEKVREAQARSPNRTGAPLVKRLIEADDAHTKSEFERRYTSFTTRLSLPRPDHRNVRVAGHQADCVYDGARLVVELDGRAYHQRRGQMRRDRQRDFDYQMHGYRIIRLVWDDLHPREEAATARKIRAMLRTLPRLSS